MRFMDKSENFVLLFAMSTTQQETYKKLVQSLRSALGAQTIPEAGTGEGLQMHAVPSEESTETTQIDELGGMIQKEMDEIISEVRELVTFPSNWELSSGRACAVVRLIVKHGVNPNLVSAEGYAGFHPVATNDTEEGRSQNRRVEIVYERDSIAHQFSDMKISN
jgi:hypothetical protein